MGFFPIHSIEPNLQADSVEQGDVMLAACIHCPPVSNAFAPRCERWIQVANIKSPCPTCLEITLNPRLLSSNVQAPPLSYWWAEDGKYKTLSESRNSYALLPWDIRSP
ncbi:hypothetical protein Bbelb_228290 [Branchiostoma belcheri]|nr:hypothetical protein Bbelb_228290 [Branchiostoma belcheri]